MNKLLLINAGGTAFIVLFALMTVAVFLGFVWFLCAAFKGGSLKLKLKPKYILLIVLAVGAALRMVVAFSVRGQVGIVNSQSAGRTGYTGLVRMVESLLTDGFNSFSVTYGDVAYYPLTMYIVSFFGAVLSIFGKITFDSEATLIMLKLPFVISDILLAYVIYKIAKKYTNEQAALGFGGFVALCPVFMLGAIWPSVYTFLALALAAAMYFMLERKYILLTVMYTVSLLISFEAIYLLPVIAVFIIYAYIKKLIAFRHDGGDLMSKDNRILVFLPVTVIACMIASYLLILPFALGSIGANPFVILYSYYLKPFDNFEYFTFNGLSLYTIFGKNGSELSLSFPTFVFSLLFIAAIIAVTLIIYLTKKNRANLVMLSSYLLLTLNVYFVNSSELTLLVFLVITLLAFAVNKDKRLLQIVGIMSLFVFINATGVLLKADYFTLNATYVPEELNGSWAVLSIFSSVIAILAHIYYTVILLDIVMEGRIRKLAADDNGFGSAIKGLIRIK